MTKTTERDPILDAVKGFLILCIVLEHNNLLTSQYDWIRPFSDAFAAGCFLIFTFAWPIKNLPIKAFINKHFSYWWPYFLFISATTILNSLMFVDLSLINILINYIKAVFLASPADIKSASGFMYFWFLPCLCLLYLIRLLSQKAIKTSFIIAILTWLFIGVIEDEQLTFMPFSVHVISFIFVLGLGYKKLHNTLIYCGKSIKLLSVFSFFSCAIASSFVGWELFLAGGIIPSWQEPQLLIFYSFFMIIAIPGIYHILALMPKIIQSIFTYLGEKSLIVYLFHPLVFITITKIIPVVNHGILSLIITLGICLFIAFILEKLPLINQFVFPSSLQNIFTKRNQ